MTAGRSIIPIFIPHSGCPNDCVFCNQKRISGSLFPADGESVRRDIAQALEKLPVELKKEVAFYGGSFTAIPVGEQEELLSAAGEFMARGEIHALRLSTRPDAIDPDTLARLKRYGVRTIELGSQSMCEDVLLASGRGHTAEDTVRAAGMIKKAGFQLILQMMTGLPGSSSEKDMESARTIAALHPDGVRIYPTVIVKDTALYDMWRRGEYAEHTVENAVELCSQLLPVFRDAGIPVIRLGLNPTEELSAGAAAGGAYHPALGEMVLSRMLLKKVRPLLEKFAGQDVVVSVHPKRVSAMVGQKRQNLIVLKNEFRLHSIKVLGNAVNIEDIRVHLIAKR